MSNPENPTEFTSESINQMLEDGLFKVTTSLYIVLSDPKLRDQAMNHPDIGAEAVLAYEALGDRFNGAQAQLKADPKSHPAWAAYHHACADIMRIGGTLLDKINAAGIKPDMQ